MASKKKGVHALADHTYKCTVEIPQPSLPACVTTQHHFQWPPARTYMVPDDGAGCPFWEKITP